MNEPTQELEFKAFKDGVYDAIIHGSRPEWEQALRCKKWSSEYHGHYYKRGYDFGMTIHSDMEEE